LKLARENLVEVHLPAPSHRSRARTPRNYAPASAPLLHVVSRFLRLESRIRLIGR